MSETTEQRAGTPASEDNGNSCPKVKDANVQTDDEDNNTSIEIGVSKAMNEHVRDKIGKYASPIDTSPKPSDLRIGNLQIGDNNKDLKKYGK
jgi:hypothetical protein